MIRGVSGLAAFLVMAASTQAAYASPPPPIEAYARLPSLEMVTLSPSGEHYAYVTRADGQPRVVVADATKAPLDTEALGPMNVEFLTWAGDDHLLVFLSKTIGLGASFPLSKEVQDTVLVINLKQKPSPPTPGHPRGNRLVVGPVMGYYGSAAIKGKWYAFIGGYTARDPDEFPGAGAELTQVSPRQGLFPDLYRIDLDGGALSITAKGAENVQGWLVSPAGEVAARLLYDDYSGLWRIKSSHRGGAQLASGRSPTGRISVIGFGRTADTTLIKIDGEDHDTVLEAPISGGPAKAVFDADQVGSPLIDRVTSLWIGSILDDDRMTSKLFSPEQEARLHAAFSAIPGAAPHLVSYSADFSRMIVLTDGVDDSGTYWMVDNLKGAVDPLGHRYPAVGRGQIGPARWFDYKAADGLAMRGVLTLPPGREARNLPLVVIPHGGPEAHDTLRFDYWAQAFAARGYAVFQPNFRGSTGAGNRFRDAGFGQWGRGMQTDVSDGMAELARQGVIDPRRACIVGWSYGGYAALAGVTLQQGLYRCAVSYGGIADLSGMLVYDRRRAGHVGPTTRYWQEFLGVGADGKTQDKAISPLRFADRADAPILLIHGEDDVIVPVEQSRAMDKALRRAGKPVTLMVLPGADHWLLEEDARIAMLKASVDFVLKANPPDATATAVAAVPAAAPGALVN